MNSTLLSAMTCALTAATAFGGPRESVTFTNVESWGRLQQTDGNINQNPTLTHTFAGTGSGGGAYTATHLTISGALTRISVNGFFCEAMILVTPPGGAQPFLVQPFNTPQTAVIGGPVVTNGSVPVGAYTVPLSPLSPAGEWSFLFYDRFNDIAGRDAVWDTVTITLNDGPAPAAAPIGAFGHTFTNVTVNQPDGGGFDQSFTLPSGLTAGGLRIRAAGTALMTPNVNTRLTPTNNLRVRVTPPGGSPLAPATVFPLYSPSSDIAETLVSLPGSTPSQGNWRVEAFMNVAGHEVFLHTLAVELVPPSQPTAVNLGTLVAGVPATGATTVTGSGQTKWFRFTLTQDLNPTVNVGLQIDTEASTTTDGNGALNTSLGLYTAEGSLVAFDLLDGTQSLGALSLGVDNHPAPGDGLPFNGRDGAVLPPGEYFVAVTAGDTGVTYQQGVFGVVNTSSQTGAVAVSVRLMSPGATPPAGTNVGTVGGTPAGDQRASVYPLSFTQANQVHWVRFNTVAPADFNAGTWLDIFTTANSPAFDTEIGVYSINGSLIGNDDDDGVGYNSFLSYGFGSLETIGDAGNGGAAVFSDGRDGWLDTGTYFLAVASYNAVFGQQFWAVTTNGADLGTVPVHFVSNIPTPASCPADIGTTGGQPGSDGVLNNNDFIVFIDLFFNQNPQADIGSTGGAPGSDGLYNNNDFIVFIDRFFAGCG